MTIWSAAVFSPFSTIIFMCDYRKLIVITNRHLCGGDFAAQIEKVCALDPGSLVLREKDLSDDEYEALAMQISGICEKHGVTFYIHSHIDLAIKHGFKSIHLPVSALRECKNNLRCFENISVSCHSEEDVKLAEKAGASRIILGTVFETECKPGFEGRGLAFVKEICKKTALPVYAIGGITPQNLGSVIEAGAAGGCMMSGFMKMQHERE